MQSESVIKHGHHCSTLFHVQFMYRTMRRINVEEAVKEIASEFIKMQITYEKV